MKYEFTQEDIVSGYIVDNTKNQIITLCHTKRPDLGFESLKSMVVEANKTEIYKQHWDNLLDQIIAEVDRDGWCRLVITMEKALRIKEELNKL